MTPSLVLDVGGSGGAAWRLNGSASPLVAFEWAGAPNLSTLGGTLSRVAAAGETVLVATPGQLDLKGRLFAANLGWSGLTLGPELGLDGLEIRWVNDAALIAAAERCLHRLQGDLLALVVGTGLGVGIAGRERAATAMWAPDLEAGHLPTGTDLECACGRRGCLEAALREWLDGRVPDALVADSLSRLIARVGSPEAVVICGGRVRQARSFQRLAALVPAGLPVLRSAAPAGEKSAAPFGAAAVWPSAARA